MKLEYTADSNYKFDLLQAKKCLYTHNFVKINKIFDSIIPFLFEIRDAIEMADFFQVNYNPLDRSAHKIDEPKRSNKDLVYERFKDPQLRQKNPIINLEELPLGRHLLEHLCKEKMMRFLINALIPNVKTYQAYKTVFRPSQNANSSRKTNWQWHQDAYFHRTLNDITIWIPLGSCGKEAPGLEFLNIPNLRKILKKDDHEKWFIKSEIQRSLENTYQTFSPEFNIGDCVVFNSYAIHRTYVTSGMLRDRASIDIRINGIT